MHNKLESSVKNLTAWTDKILTDSKGSNMRLQGFIETYNIKDFQQFYRELLPYVNQLKSEDPELFGNLVTTFEGNISTMSEAMKESSLYNILLNIFSNFPAFGRSANDLIDALKQIQSNTMNLENALRVFRS